MVEIGGMPILWHIMKIYSTFGFNDFIICLGYKGYIIKEYFANYFLHRSDVTINLKDNRLVVHDSFAEPWNITLIDTGLNTMTGGRIKQIQKHTNGEPFFLTYGDGLSDVNISASLDFHKRNNKLCTVTAVQPSGRFGAIGMDTNNLITTFIEKPKGDGSWINGGFFVCEPGIFNFIQGDASVWEGEPMETLAKSGEMIAYRHDGFWRPMDALRDKIELEELWSRGQAKWKIW
jgi:glucose-1-phosphate cytidylyltransferase